MLLNIVKQLNWVDIFVVIILLRTLYIAARNGLVAEFFKILGTTAAIYIALHYYTALSDYAGARVKIPAMPLEFLDFLSFFVLVVGVYLTFVFLRKIFCNLIKIETLPRLNKWGGFLLGIARAGLLASLVIFMLTISSINYLKTSVIDSYSGKNLLKVATTAYSTIWNKFMSKFMTKEKFNRTIYEVEEGLRR